MGEMIRPAVVHVAGEPVAKGVPLQHARERHHPAVVLADAVSHSFSRPARTASKLCQALVKPLKHLLKEPPRG
jgi:uncharacterized protein with von Willebrand factor type A (vWA) domain